MFYSAWKQAPFALIVGVLLVAILLQQRACDIDLAYWVIGLVLLLCSYLGLKYASSKQQGNT